MKKIINNSFADHQKVVRQTLKLQKKNIINFSNDVLLTLKNHGKLIFCGNGGSAADSMHISSEFVGKFKKKRIPLQSVSLNSDVANLTCIANDFGYKKVFSRQLISLAKSNDLLICLSTSGNSKNIIDCLKTAKKLKIKSVLLSGKNGGVAKSLSNLNILIPSMSTARIQEMHVLIGQIICEVVEKELNLN